MQCHFLWFVGVGVVRLLYFTLHLWVGYGNAHYVQ